MPELPEVETLIRGLAPDVTGRTITAARVDWGRTIHELTPEDFSARIAGQRIESITRRAKYIVMTLDADYLIVHLRMTGRLYVALPTEENEADAWLRVVLTMDNGYELRFSDMRKFGRMYLTADKADVLGKIGPEPLADDFTVEDFTTCLANSRRAIKPLLLDQSRIAGVGNIYADEACWCAQIDPRRKANTLTDEDIAKLYDCVRRVMFAAIEHEGSTISWYRKADGTTGSHQNHFMAYDQQDQPCARCGETIIKIRLAQRGTHYCPGCQR